MRPSTASTAPASRRSAWRHGKLAGEERKEEQKKFDAWAATIPKTDYAGMCAALERERLELEAAKFPEFWNLK
jgi:hypothetical protein